MSRAEDLRQTIRTLMRVMLISERTPEANRHVVRFNPHDFHTLGLLAEHVGMRATELARRLGVAPTTASSLIARLVRQGLVARDRDAKDGRAVALSLTQDGQALAAAIHAQDLRNMELFLSALDPQEQEQIVAILGKIAARVAALEAES